MKKTLLTTLLAVSILNTSCASIMTKTMGEKKEISVENNDANKELVKSTFKPSFESLENKDLKIKLNLENTYSVKRTQTITSKRDIPWQWSLLTAGGTALAAFFVPVGTENASGTLLTIGVASLVAGIGDFFISSQVSTEKEIKDLDKTESLENIPLANSKVSFINSQNQDYDTYSDSKGELVLKNAAEFLGESSQLKVDNKNNWVYKISKADLSDNTKPKSPPILYAKVKFTEPSKTGMLNALETGFITLEVTNKGKDSAKRLKVKLLSSSNINGMEYPLETIIQRINANETKSINIPVKGASNLQESNAKFSIEVQEPFYQADADPIMLSFKTRALRKPDLKVEEIGLEDEVGNKFTLGKETTISTIIKNKGAGLAKNVKVSLNVPSDSGVSLINDNNSETLTFDLGNMEAGTWKKVSFTIFAPKKYNKQEIPFSIALSEDRIKFSNEETLKISVNKPMKKIEEVVIAAKEENVKVQNEVAPSLNIDVDNNIPNRNVNNPNGIAVIIGNRNYKNKDIPTVEYAIRDAKVVKEYLKNAMGFKDDNIIYLEDATQAEFTRLFGSDKNPNGDLVNKYIESGKSDVFIYYSGHGAPDANTKSAYFVPVDTAPDSISLNGYPLETFYTNLGKYNAKSITVVLDSCFSGSSQKGMIIKNASPLFIDVKNKFNIASNIDILTSSSGEQISSWYDDKKHSLFTYYFLKALQLGNRNDEEQINPDSNNDNKLSLEEVHKYISTKVKKSAKRLYGRDQTPELVSKDSKKVISKF